MIPQEMCGGFRSSCLDTGGAWPLFNQEKPLKGARGSELYKTILLTSLEDLCKTARLASRGICLTIT